MTPTETGPIGSIGSYTLSFQGGKASVSVQGAVDNGAVQVTVSATADANAFIDQLFAAIEKASPAGAVAIEEGVKTIIKAAVAALP